MHSVLQRANAVTSYALSVALGLALLISLTTTPVVPRIVPHTLEPTYERLVGGALTVAHPAPNISLVHVHDPHTYASPESRV